MELNIYAVPAAITLVLLLIESVFLVIALPETRVVRFQTKQKAQGRQETLSAPVQLRLKLLKSLGHLHFLFLGIFAGVEFTLTFLTFDCRSVITLHSMLSLPVTYSI